MSAQKVEVLCWWNSNKENTLIWPGLQEGIFRQHHLSVYYERLFSEANDLYEQERNQLLPKIGEKLLFLHHNLKKKIIGTFVD